MSDSDPPKINSNDATHPKIPLLHIRTSFSGDKLERDKGDFKKWERDFMLFVTLNHLDGYFFAPLTQPPHATEEPRAHSNFITNSRMAVAALQQAIGESEMEFIDYTKGAKVCYDIITSRCRSAGPVKQISLIREALSTYCSLSEPLVSTATKICNTIDRAFAMGDITQDLFKCIALLNSLNDKTFESIQSNISRALSDSTKTTPYTSDHIRRVLESEDTLISTKRHMHTQDVALSAKSSSSHNHGPHDICCSNCFTQGKPCRGHKKEWCIRKGGGMEGKTIAESTAARRAANGKGSGKPSEGSGSNKISVPVTINGKAHIAQVDPSSLQEITTDGAFAGLASSPTKGGTSSTTDTAWLAAAGGELKTSVNWSNHTTIANESALAAITSLQQTKRTPMSTEDFPFYADTGASVYITMDPNDFLNLEPIPTRFIGGVGGSSLAAIGMGKIRLRIAKGKHLELPNALYAPTSTVRLISISSLSIDSNTVSRFDADGVKIYDKSTGAFLLGGALLPNRLYSLNLQSVSAEHALSAQHVPDLMTWHRRLGHTNFQTIREMAKLGTIAGMPSSFPILPPKCESCILGKQTKTPVPKMREEGHRATRRLGIVWVDLTGPAPVQSREGYKYIMNLVDDYTNKPWTIPLKLKSDALGELKVWERAREVETGLKIGTYRTGHDGELSGHQMENWLRSTGTDQQFGAPYTSAHIGRVERMHRTLMNKGRAIRISTGCPPNMWVEFYLTACHLHEKTPTKSLKGLTPYELWHNRKPDYSYIREIGCKAFVLIQNRHNPKIYEHSVECILVGYNPKAKEYRCYDKRSGQIYSTYHVRFLESHEGHPPPTPVNPNSMLTDSTTLNQINDTPIAEPITFDDDDDFDFALPTAINHDDPVDEHPDNIIPPPNLPVPPIEPRRSTRVAKPTEKVDPVNHQPTRVERAVQESRESAEHVKAARIERRAHVADDVNDPDPVPDLAYTGGNLDHNRPLAAITETNDIDPTTLEFDDEPKSWREARESADAKKWEEGYRDELKSLKDMGVYELVPRSDVPRGHKVRKGRPIFKIKRDESGKAIRFKVRLVFKGYEQIYGKDYTKTTSPTARMESWRILLHIAASQPGWNATQIDVKTAFLYGLLPSDEVQYMEQPEGFEEEEKGDWVWRLVRGLYGMKQSGRIWNQTLNENMISWGFTRLACESCIYYRTTDTGTVIAAVHVDDFLSIASSKDENDRFKDQMRQVWTISDLGTPRFVVGIGIEWDQHNSSVKLSQTALIDKLISQFGQKDATPLSLPMDPGLKLRRVDRNTLTNDERERLSKIPYRSLVGGLLYLAISTRPDISYAVQQLTQYVDSYTEIHWNAAIRLVRYLKGTRDLKLTLGSGNQTISLQGFTDSDWANCLDTRRSIGGYTWNLGSGAISWAARKQKTVAASSCKAEYMAAFESAQECIWLRALLKAIGHDVTQAPTTMLCDNNAAINLSEDPLLHARVKHVDIKYHFLRERVQSKEIAIQYIHTKNNVADIFTKALPAPLFNRLRSMLGLQ